MKKSTVLLVVMISFVLLSTTLRAAVTFDAGEVNTAPGGPVSVPIIVNGFTDVSAFQFTLSWNSSLLTLDPLTPVTPTSALSVGISDYNDSIAGSLSFLWLAFTEDSETLDPNTTILTILFSANAGVGTSIPVSFTDDITDRLVTFADNSEGTPLNGLMITVDGGVTVVPEPVNYALGLFAGIFGGVAGVRWIVQRRLPRRLQG